MNTGSRPSFCPSVKHLGPLAGTIGSPHHGKNWERAPNNFQFYPPVWRRAGWRRKTPSLFSARLCRNAIDEGGKNRRLGKKERKSKKREKIIGQERREPENGGYFEKPGTKRKFSGEYLSVHEFIETRPVHIVSSDS